MQESSIKTTPKQRIIMLIVAFIMIASFIAIYALVAFGNESTSSSDTSSTITDEQLTAYMEDYETKSEALEVLSQDYSSTYFETFSSYKTAVKSFNATSANENGLQTEDLLTGTGEKLTSESTGYAAFYVGWCSDETVFDSSFDDFSSPSKLSAPLLVEADSLITGWYQGVDGMRIGGVRVVTIPGDLAYGDSYNPCDTSSDETNVPLKFLIMPIEVSDEFKTASSEANSAYMRYLYAMYGLTYEE